MAVDVSVEVLVERSPEEVAALMFHPKKDKLWLRSLREVYPMESGLYKQGSKIERVGIFLTKHYSAKLLVTKFKENEMVQLYADEPFEMNIRYDLSAADGGTNVKYTISSVSDIPFNSPISIISGKIKEDMEGDLKKLKKHLEEA